MEWINGRELLEPPHSFTKQQIIDAVKAGILVPWEFKDGIDKNRAWRVFPTPEQQKKWLECERLRFRVECIKKERIQKHDDTLFAEIIENLAREIEELEKELSPDRVWKEVDLVPGKREDLLNSYYDDADIHRLREIISGHEKERDRLEKNTKFENGGNLGPAKGFRHSGDFRCVNKDGIVYDLTPHQAHVIQILWENYEQGTPNVSQDDILEHISPNTTTKRVSDIFKNNPKAYRALIGTGPGEVLFT